jgi:glycine oxidase
MSDSDAGDVIVIGGGILGLSTAWRLLRAGLPVVIVDDAPESSATRAAAGMLAPFTEVSPNADMQALLARSLEMYPGFVEEIEREADREIEIEFPGTILLVTAEQRAGLVDQLAAQDIRAEALDASALRELEPDLSAESAILFPGEGYVDPRALHDALREAFARRGGRWISSRARAFERAPVETTDREHVTVRTAEGIVRGRIVLNAAGVGAGELLGEELRTLLRPRPVRGEIVRLRPRSRAVRHLVHKEGGIYLVPRRDGTLLVGATAAEGETPRVTAGGVRWLLDRAVEIIPSLNDAEFVEAWSGARPLAGDGAPEIIEDPSGSVFHGVGLYRNGILLAPLLSAQLEARILEQYHTSAVGVMTQPPERASARNRSEDHS